MSGIFLVVSALGERYLPFLCMLGIVGTFPLYYLITKFKDKINVETD